jgi:hypothetical protein
MSDGSSRKRIARLRAVAPKNLTPEGANALIQLIDPFHDTDVPPTGFPDFSTDASVVACVEKTVSIQCPASITTGTWDCNIFTLPLLAGTQTASTNPPAWSQSFIPSGLTSAVPAAGTFTPTPVGLNVSTGLDFSTVNYVTCQTGTNCLPSGATQVTPATSGYIDAGQTWTNGNSRIAAGGMEVVNSTAEISQQGAVAYYHMPQVSYDNAIMLPSNSATTNLLGLEKRMRMPPTNIAEAMLLRGTVVRKAKDGGYVPFTFNSSENDFANTKNVVTTLAYTDGPGSRVLTNRPTYSTTTGLFNADASCQNAPLDSNGMYFTGLSLTTSLQLTCRFYIEKVPAPADAALAVLTRPACPYDPVALEWYKRIIRDMPPGTAVADNASGDWWNSLLGIVAKAAPLVGAVLAPFTGGASLAIGGAVSAAAGAAQSYDTARGEIVHKTPSNMPPLPPPPPPVNTQRIRRAPPPPPVTRNRRARAAPAA